MSHEVHDCSPKKKWGVNLQGLSYSRAFTSRSMHPPPGTKGFHIQGMHGEARERLHKCRGSLMPGPTPFLEKNSHNLQKYDPFSHLHLHFCKFKFIFTRLDNWKPPAGCQGPSTPSTPLCTPLHEWYIFLHRCMYKHIQ